MSFHILTESGDVILTESGDNLVTENETVNLCDPNTLLANAACFSCLPAGFFLPLKLVLLQNVLTGLGGAVPSIPTMLSDGKCFSCLSPGDMKAIKLQLMCNILSNLS